MDTEQKPVDIDNSSRQVNSLLALIPFHSQLLVTDITIDTVNYKHHTEAGQC